MEIRIKCSIGEVVDKLTILEIKARHIKSIDKLNNVKKELSYLNGKLNILNDNKVVQKLINELRVINLKLWKIEDNIRIKEKEQKFDNDFIILARDVYKTNDQRSQIKKDINKILGSEIIEEKSYDYL